MAKAAYWTCGPDTDRGDVHCGAVWRRHSVPPLVESGGPHCPRPDFQWLSRARLAAGGYSGARRQRHPANLPGGARKRLPPSVKESRIIEVSNLLDHNLLIFQK